MSAEVSRIELKVGDQVISMTPDEAKELMHALGAIFDQPQKTEYVPYPVPYPIYPTYPYRTWIVTSGTYTDYNTISVASGASNTAYLKQ